MTPSTDFGNDRSLPPHPTLEHLRKEAKALLKAHGQGDASACGPLRRLRRFARAGDDEILSAQLALNDAQFALAMDYGFESWKELRDHIQRLRSGETPSSQADEGGFLPFGEREAWECVRRGVRDVEKLPEDIRARIVGITVAGSLVRGDFVTSRSDVDVYTILRDTAGSKAWESEAHSCIRECFDLGVEQRD